MYGCTTNRPTESMGRKVRTILAHSHGLESKKKSGRRRGVSLDFSFYRTSRDLGFEYLDIRATVENFRNRGKGPALKHLAGELYAGGGGCRSPVSREVKMEIPA
jgi:hypothetical protein